ncbi:hypothetical protein JCM10450v2_001555 [Rhodotorula kratochvilovae]
MHATALTFLLGAASALAAPAQLPFLRSASSAPTSRPSPFALSTNDTARSKPVHVALGVMSRCPDATLCEAVWDRVLEERLPASAPFGGGHVGALVEIELVFIARENASAPYGATCLHGEAECRGNVQQLCAARHWGRSKEEVASQAGMEGEVGVTVKGERGWEEWWNFVQCMNYGDRSRIGSEAAAKQCASVVGREWNDALASCVEGKEGRELLRKSIRRAEKLEVRKSCTVLIEEEPVCIHDGTWKSCPGGHEVRDFAREVRDAWVKLNPPARKSGGALEGV